MFCYQNSLMEKGNLFYSLDCKSREEKQVSLIKFLSTLQGL